MGLKDGELSFDVSKKVPDAEEREPERVGSEGSED